VISELKITDPKDMPVDWWDKVEALKELKQIDFKPGLNIIFGPNGSGKSTIIKSIATVFACLQSGVPRITQTAISEMTTGFGTPIPSGFDVVHDAQPVHYFSPDCKPGMSYGTMDEFFGDTIGLFMMQESSGKTVIAALERILASALELAEVRDDLGGHCNDVWQKRIDRVREVMLKASIPKGSRTILLDEPDRSLDIPLQVQMWWLASRKWSEKLQIIAASHNHLVLSLSNANIIETVPGYADRCRKIVSSSISAEVLEKLEKRYAGIDPLRPTGKKASSAKSRQNR